MQIDTVGTYIGEVAESAISTTKNGFPQWTPRLKATKKYIETPDELAHYKLTEPGYIDYSSFDEDIVAFLLLFYTDKTGETVPALNYEQAQLAVGWDGNSFETLNDSVGKSVLFRVEEHAYEGKTGLRVNWIDAENASPTKTLKALDAGAIKDLNAKFLAGRKPTAKPVVAAKPVSKPGKPAAGTATTNTTTTAPAAVPAVSVTTPAPSAPTAPKPPKAAKKVAPAPAAEAALPTEIDQLSGWNYVNEHKGANDDKTVEDAWLAACQEVGTANGGIDDQEKFTTAMWASVRDVVIKDLALS